jgi:prefoldin subunit 5
MVIKVVRTFILASVVFTFVLTPVRVYADDNEEDTAGHRLDELRLKRSEAIQRIQDSRDKLKFKSEDGQDRVRDKLEDAKQRVAERLKKILIKATRRLNAAITRLDSIAERIASRIDKLNEKGVDTSSAEAALVEAERLGAEADSAVNEAIAMVGTIDTTDKSAREIIKEAKDAIGGAKSALKVYHSGLVIAIRELKASADTRVETEGENNEDK